MTVVSTLDDFKNGRSIGAVAGTWYASELRKVPWIGESVRFYPTYDAALQHLQAGRVDALMLSLQVSSYLLRSRPDLDLRAVRLQPTPGIPDQLTEKQAVVIGAQKSNQPLVDAMNAVLRKMREDGRISKIYEKYGLKADLSDPQEQSDRPATAFRLIMPGALILTVSGDAAPYAWLDPDEGLIGICVDVIREVARELSLTLEIQISSRFDVIDAVCAGRADIVAGAMIKTEDRSNLLAMSDPIGHLLGEITQRKSERFFERPSSVRSRHFTGVHQTPTLLETIWDAAIGIWRQLAPPSIWAATEPETTAAMRRYVRTEECRGEKFANLFRCLAIMCVWISVLIGVLNSKPPSGVVTPAIYTAYIVALVVLLARGTYHPLLSYATVMTDITLVLSWDKGASFQAFHLPMDTRLVVLALVVVTCVLRHRPDLVLCAGLMIGLFSLVMGHSLCPNIIASCGGMTGPIIGVGSSVIDFSLALFLGLSIILAWAAFVSRRLICLIGFMAQKRLMDAERYDWDLERRLARYAREMEKAQIHRAVLDERTRIAREMHDGLGKSLAGLALEAQILEISLSDSAAPIKGRAQYVASVTRHLARQARDVIYNLRTPYASGSLVSHLQAYVVQWESENMIPARFEVSGEPGPISFQLEYEILRVVEEALTNVQRHAQAQAVDVSVKATPNELEISIRDDGLGMPPVDNWQMLAATGHFGLMGMRERVQKIGGGLEIKSGQGDGTSLSLRIAHTSCLSDTVR